jgi:hypothetical protein
VLGYAARPWGGLLDPSSYQLRLLSATSGASALALLVGLVSVALMRGASGLRAWLLATTAALLVCATWSAIGLSADDPAAATTIARLGAALLPLAAGTGTCFQLTLIGELRGRAWLGALLVLVGVAWVPIIAMTDLVVDGAAPAARGVLAGTAGPAALPALVYSAGVSALGLGWLGVAIRRAPGQAQRRQWSRMWWASLAIALGTAATIVVDEQTGVPVGWLLLGGGTLAVLGALWFDDLLRVRANRYPAAAAAHLRGVRGAGGLGRARAGDGGPADLGRRAGAHRGVPGRAARRGRRADVAARRGPGAGAARADRRSVRAAGPRW